ncbi:hypothetical protein ZOSMA_131G00030 [Zostera marina]|uniref:Uncharacterized protein n=1 Tax=Zostera marina TaxID=29655 RepID=A0A0K9Q1B1_ZOSMR|nr:hypothetical protein ZOSMA_131G00030 [Zostera marina]
MPYSSTVSKDCNAFLPWLEQKAGTEISSKLSIGHSTCGRSLFASDFIREGECLLKVPYSVHLTPDKIIPALESLLTADVSNIVRLAIVLLAEKKLGQVSTWASYVNSLPLCEDMHNTIIWNKDELEMVQPSSVYRETFDQKVCIEKEFYVIKHALGHFPQIFGTCTLLDFMYAYSIVGSRAWGTSKGLSLIM